MLLLMDVRRGNMHLQLQAGPLATTILMYEIGPRMEGRAVIQSYPTGLLEMLDKCLKGKLSKTSGGFVTVSQASQPDYDFRIFDTSEEGFFKFELLIRTPEGMADYPITLRKEDIAKLRKNLHDFWGC